MKYTVLKLVSAEIVMGRLDAETEDDYILEHAMLVNYMSDPLTLKTSMYLTSYNPFNIGEAYIAIAKKHIIYATSIDKEIADYYEQNVVKKLERETSSQLRHAAKDVLTNYKLQANTTIN